MYLVHKGDGVNRKVLEKFADACNFGARVLWLGKKVSTEHGTVNPVKTNKVASFFKVILFPLYFVPVGVVTGIGTIAKKIALNKDPKAKKISEIVRVALKKEETEKKLTSLKRKHYSEKIHNEIYKTVTTVIDQKREGLEYKFNSGWDYRYRDDFSGDNASDTTNNLILKELNEIRFDLNPWFGFDRSKRCRGGSFEEELAMRIRYGEGKTDKKEQVLKIEIDDKKQEISILESELQAILIK